VGALLLWFLTSDTMLLLVALGGTYRVVVGPFDTAGDRRGLVGYLVVLAALAGLALLPVPGIVIE
jgi:hypothetical protein